MDTDKSEEAGPDSPTRNTAYALAMRLLSATFAGALAIFLVRRLGPDDYGIFAVAVGIGALALFPADLGVSLSAARFVAERKDDHRAVQAILADSLWIKSIAGIVVCGALFAAAVPIANAYSSPGLAAPIRYTAIAVFAQNIGALTLGWTEALGRVSVSLQYTFVENVVETGSSVVVVLLGAGATGAAFGRAAGFGVAAVFAILITARRFGPPLKRQPGLGPGLRAIARYGTALLVIDGVMTLFNRLDVLIISAYLGTSAAGLFDAPSRLVSFLSFGVLALATGFAPLLAGGVDTKPNADSFWGATRVAIILQLLLATPILVWAEPITQLALGSSYDGSIPVLRAFAPYVVLAGIAPLFAIGVNYLGHARQRIFIAIGAVLINFAVDIWLIPRIGIVGGVVGSLAAFLLYLPAHVLILRRELGLPAKRLGLTCGRALLAASAAGAVLFAFGTSNLSAFDWVAGTLGAVSAYGVVLIATREVTTEELRHGRVMVARLRKVISPGTNAA